jgi:RNA polymerase sigma-70 factor (ECF subfamily)
MDDAALVRQVLAGQNDAYAELVLRWGARIIALCHARLGRADLAEELAQETLVRGYEELSSLAEPARFGSWLAGIAANTCRDWLKARKNTQAPLSGAEVDAHLPEPARQVEQQDEIARLLAEVENLPEDCRTVLMLFYYQKATYRDIAQILDLSTATVNARLTKARNLLRARLAGPNQSM